jgi:hypothetical protein
MRLCETKQNSNRECKLHNKEHCCVSFYITLARKQAYWYAMQDSVLTCKKASLALSLSIRMPIQRVSVVIAGLPPLAVVAAVAAVVAVAVLAS